MADGLNKAMLLGNLAADAERLDFDRQIRPLIAAAEQEAKGG
jgi:hypothetical protein